MKTLQITGPFLKGKTINPLKNINKSISFIQIGIEVGTSIPYQLDISPIVKINQDRQKTVNLKIGETCIIEWDNFSTDFLEIIPLVDLDEYTIIDLAYE